MKIKKCYEIFTKVYIISYFITLFILNKILRIPYSSEILSVCNLLEFIVITYVLIQLVYFLKTLHFFEFKKNIKHLIVYFVFTSFQCILKFLMLYIEKFMKPNNSVKELFEICYIQPDNYTWFFTYTDYALNNIHLLDILNAMTILYIKGTDDILQGISKLDYLLKVSAF